MMRNKISKLIVCIVTVIIFSFISFGGIVHADGNEDKILIDEDNPFDYKDSNNVVWGCKLIIKGDKLYAGIYRCKNAGPELYFPEIVKDELGNEFTVIDIFSDFSYYSKNDKYDLAIVHLPNTVELIDEYAFSDYSLLYDIYLPDNSNLVIGEGAFRGCGADNALETKIHFGESKVTIKGHAFDECTGIKSLVFPSDNSDISIYAFRDCYNIESIKNHPRDLSLDYLALLG